MTQQLRKYWLFLLAFGWALGLFLVFQHAFKNNFTTEIDQFQIQFLNKEKQLDEYLERKLEKFETFGVSYLIENPQKSAFNFHVYRNDSLIYWNTNQLPVSRFADIHYPASGIVHLQNGWYYAKQVQKDNIQLVASFLIKKDYGYENEHLVNGFNPSFTVPFKGNIQLDPSTDLAIYNGNKQFVFAFNLYEKQAVSTFLADALLVLLLLTVSTFILAWQRESFRWKPRLRWLAPLAVLAARLVHLQQGGFDFLSEVPVFQPTLYASSIWFPNFGEMLVNVVLILYLSAEIRGYMGYLKANIAGKTIAFSLFFGTFLFAYSLHELYRGLVDNSSIPLEIDKLFALNFYSFLSLLAMGTLFYAYFFLLHRIVGSMKETGWSASAVASGWVVGAAVVAWAAGQYTDNPLVFGIALALHGLVCWLTYRRGGALKLGTAVFLLFLFAVYIAVSLKAFHDTKERAERELYANQLASDQDVATEVEYLKLKPLLTNDAYLQKVVKQPNGVSVSMFKETLERNYFHHFWERYDIEFFFFDRNNEPIINYKNISSSRYSTLEAIINRHSLMSELDSNVYYIKDYTSQYSYILRQPVKNKAGEVVATLYCALKSKKIPEKIGFPRLLISKQAKVLNTLENYSIAKYYNGKLVSSDGRFAYPSRASAFTRNMNHTSGYFDLDGFEHYLLRKTARDLIVLSKQEQTTIQFFTSFSYLFCFFGIFLLVPIFVETEKRANYWKGLSLSVRIQIVLIGLVFVALVTFGWGSGTFVKEQYQVYTNQLIREKMRSVEIEVQQKLGEEKKLSIEEQGNYMEFILQKLSTVFVTDINLYDRKGLMLASSRPKIYNIGLVSDQMNPEAFWQLKYFKKSEFIHQEQIGNLAYLSAYVPLYSNEGKLLSYLNLQHFGQQKGFEDQIEQFLVAIMNVFILLLALSVVTAIFVSNWVTSPLRILQRNFASIQLGKFNKPIDYDADDEIGTLVKDYNQKIVELEIAAKQLAQNERESAWREMAKQVAHEIKNPLTPMKLSLQHLQRAFDPNDPSSKEKIDRVASSIIEQIDALTKIANEFSNFAKMPKPNEINLDLVPLLENVILVFQEEGLHASISLHAEEPQIWILGDKDLMIRVFNNLIKNALQAIPDSRKGEIHVYLRTKGNMLTIEVKDNGRGIPAEARKKMFVPYFTTKSTGTGLGLAIVKQIIEIHSGSIWFNTTENEGTSFFIELPRVIRIKHDS